ncbi:MAG: Mu transposase domain-containing protein, partial [Thermoanaerobaculia bacterium]
TFDSNRYSIPPEHVGRLLVIAAEIDRIRIFDAEELIAEHVRSWDKGQVIEDAEHLEDLRRHKRAARRQRDQHRLIQAVPRAEELLRALAQRQRRLTHAVARLVELLAEAGPGELAAAVAEALERGSPHPQTVRLILDRRRHERGLRPALPVQLPADAAIRELVVTPHRLADYDPDEEKESDR